jgi:hypothetical protein
MCAHIECSCRCSIRSFKGRKCKAKRVFATARERWMDQLLVVLLLIVGRD